MDGLRKWWNGLSKGERGAILIVAPIVALALIIAALRGRDRATADTAKGQMDTVGQVAGGPTGGYGVEPGTAIGVDQLADYQNATTEQFDTVYGAIDETRTSLADLTGMVEGIQVGESSPGGDDDQPVQEANPDAAKYEQQVRDLFAEKGVPLDWWGTTDDGQTRAAPQGPDERAARIGRQLASGNRTWKDVVNDVGWLRTTRDRQRQAQS